MNSLANDVANMAPEGFWITIIVFVVLALLGFWSTFRYFHRMRIIADTPTSKVHSAAQGYVEFNGIGELMEGTPIIAPLTGRECTWYRFKVEEKHEHYDSKGHKRTQWRTLRKGVSDELFLLVDETGKCVIDPEGADVTPSMKDFWYGNTPHPSTGPPAGGRSMFSNGRYRYREERMRPGDTLYAIGLFKTVGGAGDLGNAGEEIKTLLKNWKSDPARMRQFDANGDGKIDMDEWETARKAARAEVNKARGERAAKSGTNLMTRPMDKRRPYLLSVVPQNELANRYRWYMLGSLAGFFLTGAAIAWMLNVRF